MNGRNVFNTKNKLHFNRVILCINSLRIKQALLLLLCMRLVDCNAQNTFQKLYNPGSEAKCFGAYQLNDAGYVFTGTMTVSGTSKIFLARTDCDGDVVWCRTFNNAGSAGNISQRAIPTSDNGFLLAASIGSFGAYNILLAKTDASGNVVWQKIMQGNGDDVVNSVIETSDHRYVIAGKTNSFGQEVNSSYSDVYIAKFDTAGNLLWGKTYGTYHAIDEAFDIVETQDSGFAATGRYLEQGTFYCFLLKTDNNGNANFLKAYGDTNQYTTGYGMLALQNGGFAICGSTTIMKTNFQSYGDEFIITTDQQGDTVWCRTYHGNNPDGSENASSIIQTSTGYAIAVATMSYPTIGFVPNKHVILTTDFGGNMTMVRSYNQGGSHYPYITKPFDGIGILLSGFTTNYSSYFTPLMIRTDNAYNSGCNETSLITQTTMQSPPFQLRIPAIVIASGGVMTNSTITSLVTMNDSSVCENIVDTCNLTLSIGDIMQEEEVKIFYNATHNEISIAAKQNASVFIYNPEGRLLFHSETEVQKTISLNWLAAQIVFVKVITGGKTFTRKLFIKGG